MEWSDQGIVIGCRAHGERDVVLEAFTRLHGRHLGLVRSGRSRRLAAALQIGNTLALTWRARLDEHLGHYQVEPAIDRAARLIATRTGPELAQTIAAHLRLFADRDPHPMIHEAASALLDHADDLGTALTGLVRLELLVLAELGFGLDLAVCALTGATADLAFVSPRTGRAATAEAGRPYADRLLRLPAFLGGRAAATDLDDGLRLTGHFLHRDIWGARGIEAPVSRDVLLVAAARLAPAAGGGTS